MRWVIEVARRESISAAARALGVSQPALTRTIGEVESELGVELFYRSPQGVELTEEGERFNAGALRILSDFDSLLSEFPAEDGPLSGSLRVGFSPSGCLTYARAALAKLAASHPKLHISVFTGAAEAVCPRLLYGELDIVVGSSSYLERWRELDVQRHHQLCSVCLLRRGHPLAAEPNPTEIDVLRYPAIMVSSVHPVHSNLASRHIELGLPPFQPHYVTDNMDLILQLVENTDGYFPLTELGPGVEAYRKRFHILENVLKFPMHYLSVARPRNRKATRASCLFEQLFLASLA
ncbi:MAG: LysR family transcriptional regulator [Pseudomonadota bacterium]